MASKKVTGKDLRKIGYPEGRVIGVAMKILEGPLKSKSKSAKLKMMEDLYKDPESFREDKIFFPLVREFEYLRKKEQPPTLASTGKNYEAYGAENIEPGAVHQMELAMKLPITVGGALMADAHQGYGLPIGGVLAADNAVIPYGVGVDIGCRMALSIFDIPAQFLDENTKKLKQLLNENTRFGNKEVFNDPFDDPVLEREEFNEIKVVKSLKDRAWKQIGTSGSGNHFVEFGIVNIVDPQNEFGLPVGKYIGLLSHSGSRGLGAEIARHYTKLAKDLCPLPGQAQHLAWLSLDSEEGAEYWRAMTLAGDYASANHHHIHRRMVKALGEQPLAMVENHHNFAWKEQMADGREVIVHRKGATPAGKGVLGIIPGSMTAPGFIVRGRGEVASINSASHGAGRLMSRTKAKQTLQEKYVKDYLREHGVELIGGGLDEAPMAYKDINQVMNAQQELVDILGTFTPKVVRMDG